MHHQSDLIALIAMGFVADSGLAGQLAEIGVILLMFGVGTARKSCST